jgi:hydroxymethylpyrimidine/phosphomethylpyrimidine kinase
LPEAARPRLLIIAGSDSSGGAGLQADIKTAAAFGVCAMTAVTAVTVQDSTRVHAIHLVSAVLVRDQIAGCLADIGCDAIKIGMLGSAEIVTTIADILEERARGIPLVLDPVLASTSGTRLLEENAVSVLKQRLFPLTTLLTPNIPEAETLAGTEVDGTNDMRRAGETLRVLGCKAVLVKGGHAQGETAEDVLVDETGAQEFASPRIRGAGARGTGCMLATAVACGLAQQIPLTRSVVRARKFVREQIRTAAGAA